MDSADHNQAQARPPEPSGLRLSDPVGASTATGSVDPRPTVASERITRTAATAATGALAPPVASSDAQIAKPPRERARLGSKRRGRAFDLAVIALLAPVMLPLAAVIALAIRITSRGPVLYRATRIGLGGRPFPMLKFRTMRVGVPGPPLTRAGDERFTVIGGLLAASGLDELPQAWNVLTGDMRVVGPRPEDPGFVAIYRAQYDEILAVPPGITGPTQLVHFGDSAYLSHEDPSAHYAERILPRKLVLDAGYVRSHTVAGDTLIVARTGLLPFRRAAGRARRIVAEHPRASALVALGLIAAAAVALLGV